ncbi:MAG: FAD:protein FMN transferase [Opitutaceae bacterium]|nr:FAD:protein FMN transferase [Opitutaceae bacterium]
MRHWPVFAAVLFFGGVSLPAAEPIALSGRAMGTTWSVRFLPPATPLDSQTVSHRVPERLEQLEQQFSTYRATSEISRFNAADTREWIPVSTEFARVAAEARQLSELTQGAFDATVAPLVRLWGFGPDGRAAGRPTRLEISAARRHVDWRAVEIRSEPPALRKKDPLLTVDFSSIAKGFTSDQVGELLRSLGATNYIVQVGGDVKAEGRGPGGESGWRTGIEVPRPDARAIACVVELSGEAVSTSGDYRNFFTAGGRRYGHIIDPRTGEPVSSTLAAVSVIESSCARSSGLATALFVLGPDEGFRLASRERIAALFFIRERGGLVPRMTPEFEARRR